MKSTDENDCIKIGVTLYKETPVARVLSGLSKKGGEALVIEALAHYLACSGTVSGLAMSKPEVHGLPPVQSQREVTPKTDDRSSPTQRIAKPGPGRPRKHKQTSDTAERKQEEKIVAEPSSGSSGKASRLEVTAPETGNVDSRLKKLAMSDW